MLTSTSLSIGSSPNTAQQDISSGASKIQRIVFRWSAVFAIIAPNGVSRDELRGMLGWMAALGGEPQQFAAISLDPYAILANGDPSQLTAAAKRKLLTALDELAEADPMFRRSDHWRRFNVGHFFTTDILDHVRDILGKASALRSLALELLIGTEAASILIPELTALMKDCATDGDTRSWGWKSC